MAVNINRRESAALINSLTAGVVPRIGLRHIAVPPRIDKYDYLVPDKLLRSSYLYNQVNVSDAERILNNLKW